MKYIFEYNEFKNIECVAFYIEPLVVKKTHMYLYDFYPKEFREKWSDAAKYLNDKYEEYLLIPLDENKITIGGAIKMEYKDKTYEIVNHIYNKLSNIEEVKLVYGNVVLDWVDKSLHSSDGRNMYKIGHKIDSITEPGIYEY